MDYVKHFLERISQPIVEKKVNFLCSIARSGPDGGTHAPVAK